MTKAKANERNPTFKRETQLTAMATKSAVSEIAGMFNEWIPF
jgi:hypothetical protein